MSNASSIGVMEHCEWFLTDNISTAAADGIGWLVSSDSGDTAFARAANAARGHHLAGALAATDNNLIELAFDNIAFYGQTGFSAIEVLFQLDVITDIAFNIGFNDDQLEDSNTLPIELSTTTFTRNANDFIGLVFDVDATNDDVHCQWADDSALSTEAIANLRMNGCSLVASKWIRARVELEDRGSGNGIRATFHVSYDGKNFEKVFNTNLDRDVALTPYIGFENRAGTAHNVYVKYVRLCQSIAD